MSRLVSTILIFTCACVDRYSFDISSTEKTLMVDGMITNDSGPYVVSLAWTNRVTDYVLSKIKVTNANVIIKEDDGNYEVLKEVSPGLYRTSVNGIQGKIGHYYHVEVETKDGGLFYSEPEELKPAGEIDSIYFKIVYHQAIVNDQLQEENGFNIFINGKKENDSVLFRWRWTGVYELFTHPELALAPHGGSLLPLPCSGYVTSDGISIQKIDRCTCCDCWVTEFQQTPIVSDNQIATGLEFKGQLVGLVPIGYRRFYNKYYFQLEQLSLNDRSYNFWKQVAVLKQAGSNLFQPTLGKIPTNIISPNGHVALGIFSACGVARKNLWIKRSDVPYILPDEIIRESCSAEDSLATNIQPDFWN